jgi:uncharacterized protein (DUF58 family)
MRRLQLTAAVVALGIASVATSSSALAFLFYLLLLVVGGSWLVTRLSLRGLEAGFALDRSTAQVGDTLMVSYTVRDRSHLPKLWLDVHNPAALSVRIPGCALSLRPREQRSWSVPVVLARRGHHRIDPMVIRTGDPLGLYEAYATVGPGTTIVVTPRVEPLPLLRFPAAMAEGAAARPERAAQTTPLVTGVRPYVPTDAFNRIHWRSSARHGELQVKEFEIQRTADLWLYLDLDRGVHVGLDDAATVETAVRVAAAISGRALESGRAVGLEAHGIRRAVLMADRGVRQRGKVLHLLAAVGADGATPLREVLIDGLARLRRGTTAVIITPSLDTAWVRPLAGLRRRGVAVLACIVDPLAHDTQTRLVGRVPDLGADGREAWAREVRAMLHALAEQDVPAVLVDPVRPLGIQLVLPGDSAGEQVA